MKSNGWSPDTVALQLFAHLDGEALKVALLMPDRIRERWKDLVDELSAYYDTPGRLAVIRRQFENARRRPGLDPATFAMELGILALHGFSDMKEKARDLMVCNKFIAAQQSCDLRRHLDGAAPEASIGDIVDSCRIWESHAELIAIDNWCQEPVYSQPTLLKSPPATCGSARLQYRVGSMMPASNESPRRVMHSSAPPATRYASGGVSHRRKDIPAGESASWGNAPTNGRSVGLWPVFLLQIPWSRSEPMFTVGHIFPV